VKSTEVTSAPYWAVFGFSFSDISGYFAGSGTLILDGKINSAFAKQWRYNNRNASAALIKWLTSKIMTR